MSPPEAASSGLLPDLQGGGLVQGAGEDCMVQKWQGLTEQICCLVQEGVGEDLEVMFVGCLPVEIDFAEQEVGFMSLWRWLLWNYVACVGTVQDMSPLVLLCRG